VNIVYLSIDIGDADLEP